MRDTFACAVTLSPDMPTAAMDCCRASTAVGATWPASRASLSSCSLRPHRRRLPQGYRISASALRCVPGRNSDPAPRASASAHLDTRARACRPMAEPAPRSGRGQGSGRCARGQHGRWATSLASTRPHELLVLHAVLAGGMRAHTDVSALRVRAGGGRCSSTRTHTPRLRRWGSAVSRNGNKSSRCADKLDPQSFCCPASITL